MGVVGGVGAGVDGSTLRLLSFCLGAAGGRTASYCSRWRSRGVRVPQHGRKLATPTHRPPTCIGHARSIAPHAGCCHACCLRWYKCSRVRYRARANKTAVHAAAHVCLPACPRCERLCALCFGSGTPGLALHEQARWASCTMCRSGANETSSCSGWGGQPARRKAWGPSDTSPWYECSSRAHTWVIKQQKLTLVRRFCPLK